MYKNLFHRQDSNFNVHIPSCFNTKVCAQCGLKGNPYTHGTHYKELGIERSIVIFWLFSGNLLKY